MLATHAVALVLAAAAAEPPKLLYLGLTAGSGVDAAEVVALSTYLQDELSKLKAYHITSSSDVAAALGVERQKQLLGCSDDTNCLAEIGGAMNAERMITGTVSRSGGEVQLSVSLLDPTRAQSVARYGQKLPGDVSELYGLVRPALTELLGSDPLLGGVKPKFEPEFPGVTLGLRADADVLGPVVAPAISVELAGKRFGGALTAIIKKTFGGRLEGRWYAWTLGRLRLHVGVGATAFTIGLGLRAGVGLTVRIDHFQLFVDAAYERFVLVDTTRYAADVAAVGGGVGWHF